MKVFEIEGRTVEEATKKAIAELNINDISKVKVDVMDQGKSGIFGFGVSRPAKIRVYYSDTSVDVGEITKEILQTVIDKMNIDGTVKDIKEGESKVYVELASGRSGLLIGKRGKTLEALQFLVNLMVNHRTKSDKKIILDIEAYRAKREKALRRLSKDIALRVIKTGKPWTLEPMNPFERRLIHLTLQNDKRVSTKSEGQGIYRKVKISPSNER